MFVNIETCHNNTSSNSNLSDREELTYTSAEKLLGETFRTRLDLKKECKQLKLMFFGGKKPAYNILRQCCLVLFKVSLASFYTDEVVFLTQGT